ncbi:hypothetical protein TNCV_4450391 [Trichonephila clavipes]|nr:hypothetical protein TNCV_4450391 [Trichonephila clavipes]
MDLLFLLRLREESAKRRVILEKIYKKVRDADGYGTSQAPALAKKSPQSHFPLDLRERESSADELDAM